MVNSMRFDTLAQLQAAYARGEVTGPLVLDNDSTHVYQPASDDPDDVHGRNVFTMHPDDLLCQALDLLGIPHEYV
jgi:hypothetical protein